MRTSYKDDYEQCLSILESDDFYSDPKAEDLETLRDFYNRTLAMVAEAPLCRRYANPYASTTIPRELKTLDHIRQSKPGPAAFASADDVVPMNLKFKLTLRLRNLYGVVSETYPPEEVKLIADSEARALIPKFDAFLTDIGNRYLKSSKPFWGCTMKDSGELTLTLFGMYIPNETVCRQHRAYLSKNEKINSDHIAFVQEDNKWQIRLEHFEQTGYCRQPIAAASSAGNDPRIFTTATPHNLRIASDKGDLAKVLRCISQLSQQQLNEAGSESKKTALHRAAAKGHNSICKALISAGANPNLKDKDGRTARQLAEANQHTAVVELFDEQSAASAHTSR